MYVKEFGKLETKRKAEKKHDEKAVKKPKRQKNKRWLLFKKRTPQH